MSLVLSAHSLAGVPADTEAIFGGELLVILDVGGRVRGEARSYTATPGVMSYYLQWELSKAAKTNAPLRDY